MGSMRCSQLQSILLIILLWLVTLILSSNYDLITERLECLPTPNDLCHNTSCRTHLVKRNLTYVEFSCHMPEPVDNIMVRTTMYYKFAEYRQFLIDVEENLCDFFDNKKTTLLKALLPIFTTRKVLNINSCPVQGDVIVKNLSLNSEFNPPGLPAGRYRVDVYLSSKRRPIIKVKLYVTVKPKGTAKLEMG